MARLLSRHQGGTLFFSDINEMPFDTQDELIEVLRRHEWARDGLAAPQKMSTRIIASTKQDLRGLTASGRFRQATTARGRRAMSEKYQEGSGVPTWNSRIVTPRILYWAETTGERPVPCPRVPRNYPTEGAKS